MRLMSTLDHLFDNNRAWSERIRRSDPQFFATLSRQQRPRYRWLGCADSRVPANEIVGLLPGELFEQVTNVCQTTVVKDAWNRGQALAIHGWVHGLKDGLVHALGTTVAAAAGIPVAYRAALAAL